MAVITHIVACYQAQVRAYIDDMLKVAQTFLEAIREFELLTVMLVELGLEEACHKPPLSSGHDMDWPPV